MWFTPAANPAPYNLKRDLVIVGTERAVSQSQDFNFISLRYVSVSLCLTFNCRRAQLGFADRAYMNLFDFR